ncbi:polysaccharide pyruvyl transferase family protein [Butyrivibrio sp. FCS014]|uniref:polysaccharide pyruvyl transferase family protein n=1 Tax=Butyrivibrio sp. FCS014 TaxID=1408304 RepID=UPI0004657547|nr:polysaccharide pyruvyl transferase family protein [Butyrivibrio sp. FCS014]
MSEFNKKKVGILTFHYVDNYGAVLQSWALKKYLNSMPGVCAEIINYVPDNYQIYPYEKTPHGIAMMQKKRTKYEDFLVREKLVTSPIQNAVIGNEFDYYIVGSDQVWNLGFRENVSNEYLLPNLDREARRISYAASVGGPIQRSDVTLFQKCLNNFDAISVREKASEQELKDIGIKNVITVIDPTLLIDADDYEPLIEEPVDKPQDYLLFFSYKIGDEIRKWVPFVNLVARENGLQIVHTIVNAPKGMLFSDTGSMMYEGIGEFLWYIKHAKVVVTSSYHGAILGWILERPTYVIHSDYGWDRFEQLKDIIDLGGVVETNNWLTEDWDLGSYNRGTGNLQEWRAKSCFFLEKALERR